MTRYTKTIFRVVVALMVASAADVSGDGIVQAPTAAVDPMLRFEVAFVKPTELGFQSYLIAYRDGRYTAHWVTLKRLIRSAYGNIGGPLNDDQVIGGPPTLDVERFDVDATAPGTPNAASGTIPTPVLIMLRNLLEERFALRAHVETRERSVFALVVAKQDGTLGRALRRRATPCTPARVGVAPAADGRTCGGRTGLGMLAATGVSIPTLANGLSQMVPDVGGRVVLDRTSLTGVFDFDLRWTPETAGPAGERTPSSGALSDLKYPSFFVALEEQLGLKLERTTASVDVVVVDHVTGLSPN